MSLLEHFRSPKTPPPVRNVRQLPAATSSAAKPALPSAGSSSETKSRQKIDFGSVLFVPDSIGSIDDLSSVVFAKVINSEVGIAAYLYNRIAIAKVAEGAKDCFLFVDKSKTTADEVSDVSALLKNSGHNIICGYFAVSNLILSLSQGHLNGEMLKAARDIARDPAKNALLQHFVEIVAWAYDNKVDDIDFLYDQSNPLSQVAFKVGGRYIRPDTFKINTDTMCQILGIAWQRGVGGSSPMFDPKIEQQANITLDLPKEEPIRPKGAKIRLRWSGMSNDRGTAVTMRLQRLGQSALVKSLAQAGYLGTHMKIFKRVINSEGGLVCFAGVVGSGKSTSLAQLLGMLPTHKKIQSIEDPVELDIPNALQKTVARDLLSTGVDKAFLSAARAIYRSALDVLYLGEIRDTETGGMARQVAESGHTVYTTTHARSCLGIIERFVSPQIGIPRDVLGSPDILKLLVFQALLPVNCNHCKQSPDQYAAHHQLGGVDLQEHDAYWSRIERLFGVGRSKYRVHNHDGCQHCRKDGLPELNGLAGRTVVCEMVEPDEEMVGLILAGNSLALHQYWRGLSDGNFSSDNMTGKTAMECAIYKAIQGEIDPHEIEERFGDFETVEIKRNAANAAAGAVRKAAQVHK